MSTQGGVEWANTPLQECLAPSTYSLSDKCDTQPWGLCAVPGTAGLHVLISHG